MAKRSIKRALSRSRGRTHLIAAGALALALGSVVLLRAPSHAAGVETVVGDAPVDLLAAVPAPTPNSAPTANGPGIAPATFDAEGLSGSVELSQRAVQTGEVARILAEVNLQADEGAGRRSPVAVSLVLDTSGSMHGEKIENARQSVVEMVRQLDDDDMLSLVTYDSDVHELIALTPVRRLRARVSSVVRGIEAGGGTMIPPGLELGARTLQEAPGHYVRRVVLVSDGQDGSGQSPHQIRANIQRSVSAGIAFSAMGLGIDYNETFLTNVADAGAGNYAFVANGSALEPFLRRELDQVREVLVDNVVAELTLPPGWSVRRGFGSSFGQSNSVARIPVGQIAAGQNRKVIIELEGPAGAVGALQEFQAKLNYRTLADSERYSLALEPLALRTVASDGEALAARVQGVYTRGNAVVIDEDQRQAVDAWRAGDAEGAQRLTEGNRMRLQALQAQAPADLRPALEQQQAAFQADGQNFRQHSAGSSSGRRYGLSSNSSRRGRSQ